MRVLTVEAALRELQASVGVGGGGGGGKNLRVVSAGLDGVALTTSVVTVGHLEMLSTKMRRELEASAKVEGELERSEEARVALEAQVEEARHELAQPPQLVHRLERLVLARERARVLDAGRRVAHPAAVVVRAQQAGRDLTEHRRQEQPRR